MSPMYTLPPPPLGLSGFRDILATAGSSHPARSSGANASSVVGEAGLYRDLHGFWRLSSYDTEESHGKGHANNMEAMFP